MKPGYTFQTAQFESEILASGDFQLISITLDATARYAPNGSADGSNADGTIGAKIIPKGTLVTKDADLTDGTYTVVDTRASRNNLNGTPTQYMKDAVILAETVDVSGGTDIVVKAYWAATVYWNKIKYNYSGTTAITAAQLTYAGRLKFVDGPTA